MFMRRPLRRHGSIDSRSGFVMSGTHSASSNSLTVPRPAHAGHAPCGELKLKMRGSSSSSAHSGCSGQANFSLKRCSAQPSFAAASSIRTVSDPSASLSAVSTLSAIRWRDASSIAIRSTTASTSFF